MVPYLRFESNFFFNLGRTFSIKILSCNCNVGNIDPEGIHLGSITCHRRNNASRIQNKKFFQLKSSFFSLVEFEGSIKSDLKGFVVD